MSGCRGQRQAPQRGPGGRQEGRASPARMRASQGWARVAWSQNEPGRAQRAALGAPQVAVSEPARTSQRPQRSPRRAPPDVRLAPKAVSPSSSMAHFGPFPQLLANCPQTPSSRLARVRPCPPGLCWPLPASAWHTVAGPPHPQGGPCSPRPLPDLGFERSCLSPPWPMLTQALPAPEFKTRKKRKAIILSKYKVSNKSETTLKPAKSDKWKQGWHWCKQALCEPPQCRGLGVGKRVWMLWGGGSSQA